MFWLHLTKKESSAIFSSVVLTFVLSLVQEILERVTDIDLVINLKLREEALLAKCLGRRICSECGGNFNIACIDIKGENGSPGMYMAPLLPPPHCASKLITRSDDTEEVVKERLRIYHKVVMLHIVYFFVIFFYITIGWSDFMVLPLLIAPWSLLYIAN